MFNVQEAYKIVAEETLDHHNPVWRKIWTEHLWPKVSHFCGLYVKEESSLGINSRKEEFKGLHIAINVASRVKISNTF